MIQTSLYNVLQVEETATLDEIKLAFKKRALQVHPDKGGSKEAFHLVYEALETLADPVARKKYDHSLDAGKSPNLRPSKQNVPGNKKKTSRKRGNAAAPSKAHPKAQKPSGSSKTPDCGSARASGAVPQPPESKQSRLLMMLRDLLKDLPREVRNDAISKQFSQKQRLILEKWMVDTSSATHCKKDRPPALVIGSSVAGHRIHGQTGMKDVVADAKGLVDQRCSPASDCQSRDNRAVSVARMSAARGPSKHKIRDKKKESKKRVRNACGSVHTNKSGKEPSYGARICFDSIELCARYCDLQTALEHLVILTAVKQKMQACIDKSASLEERLQEALVSCAREHGKDAANLNVRFAVHQRAAVFMGRQFMLKSPCVRNIDSLRKLRGFLEPFRAYAKKHLQGARIFWHYSPVHLLEAWERFQKAVIDAWEVAGADSHNFLQKIRACHQVTASARQQSLERWERQHMAMQDDNKRRPRNLQSRSTRHLERREGKCMAKHDKNKHRPRSLREKSTADLEQWERQEMALHDQNRHRPRRFQASRRRLGAEKSLSRKLLVLKQLLSKWDLMLKRQASLAEKKHRKELNLRKQQAKKERRRLEMLNRKRVRDEERARRESLRKRMRSNNATNDLWTGLNVR